MILGVQHSAWFYAGQGFLTGMLALAIGLLGSLPVILLLERRAKRRVNHWKRRWYHRFSSMRSMSFTRMTDATFAGKDLSNMRLSWCTFYGGDFSKASFKNAVMTAVHFEDSNLSGANLEGADLSGCDFGGCDLRGANLRGANLTNCRFRDVQFAGADLTGADLSGASLFGAELSGALLTDACLFGTDLFQTKMNQVVGLETTKAYLSTIHVSWTELPDGWSIIDTAPVPSWNDKIASMFEASHVDVDLARKLVSEYASTATVVEMIEMAKNLQILEAK